MFYEIALVKITVLILLKKHPVIFFYLGVSTEIIVVLVDIFNCYVYLNYYCSSQNW